MNSKFLALGVGLMAANAFPAYIDFASSAFSPANGQTSFSTTVNGIGLTVKASPSGAVLFWDGTAADGTDGFGVNNDNKPSTPVVGYEPDEIDGQDRLSILFNQSVYLNSIDLTDLFRESRPGVGEYNEIGSYSTNGGLSWVDFSANPTALAYPTTNGEKNLVVNSYVQSLVFKAPGSVGGKDHEFSVRGLTYGVNPPAVPEPSTLALFGIALLSLFGYTRFRR